MDNRDMIVLMARWDGEGGGLIQLQRFGWFRFRVRDFSFSVNGSGPISTHSGIPYLPLSDPGTTSSQRDPLSYSVFLMSDHCPLSTI
ncbi:hypothetical protein DSO57_1021736 [Entomophthora muscae]|uniref:Uncharacterized protein n=1 Tax=Entomophthora muscae TaxID=34485 RepID=A0ACC2RHY5_9FUNG|nr:hypothetical protein DSO57_1021736 [Entomophthora muscae]